MVSPWTTIYKQLCIYRAACHQSSRAEASIASVSSEMAPILLMRVSWVNDAGLESPAAPQPNLIPTVEINYVIARLFIRTSTPLQRSSAYLFTERDPVSRTLGGIISFHPLCVAPECGSHILRFWLPLQTVFQLNSAIIIRSYWSLHYGRHIYNFALNSL